MLLRIHYAPIHTQLRNEILGKLKVGGGDYWSTVDGDDEFLHLK